MNNFKNINFEKYYQKLNSEQKKTVDVIEGPVLVLAGPGTGKTQVLALRIANILNKTQINPYNILCLTFTDIATVEMRERLLNIIGNSAYDIEINTFHGFANKIITEYSYFFNQYLDNQKQKGFRDLKSLNDLERLKIIKKLLIKSNYYRLKPLKNNLYFLGQITSTFSNLKREEISPEKLEFELNKLLTLDTKKSKTEHKILKNKVDRTRELKNLFIDYQNYLAENGLYDYEDMINWINSAIENNQELSLILQEKYQYILVDEFQDTNSSQLKLLENLTSFFKNNPNLFVVGDKNQSIYRFQGASNFNIKYFTNKYKKASQITLKENYRSSQNIIDLYSYFINPKNKILKATNNKVGKINLNIYDNIDQEIYSIVSDIKNRLKNKTKPENIAIFVRQNSQIDELVNYFKRTKIPYNIKRSENIFDDKIVINYLNLLKFISQPNNKILWGQIVFTFSELLGLENCYKIKTLNILKNSSYTQLNSKTKKLIDSIKELIIKSSDYDTAQIFERVFIDFGFKEKILKNENYLNLINIFQSIFGYVKKSRNSLKQILDDFNFAQTQNIKFLKDNKLYNSNYGVTISTVHSAKGTEYEIVYLPQMENSFWQKRSNELFIIPFSGNKINLKQETIDEERRLFYVALSRAKLNIEISVSSFRENKNIVLSRFISELDPKLLQTNRIISDQNLAKKIFSQKLENIKLDFKAREKNWLKNKVKYSSLSPTGMTNYLRCPKDYLIKNILHIPSIKSPAQSYGTAVHKAYEDFFVEYQNRREVPTINEFTKYFNNALENEILSKSELSHYQKDGHTLIKNYYSKNKDIFTVPIHTEYSFYNHNIYFDGIPLTGKIDKIEWINPQEKTVKVIDYKTGRARSRNEILGLTKKNDKSYLYQLMFYQLLGDLDYRFKLKWKIIETELEFLDNDFRFTKKKFHFSYIEMMEFKELIKSVWSDIQALKFEHKKGDYSCDFCDLF